MSEQEFKPVKTGTTLVGVKYNGGVVLAADMRTTMGHHIHGKKGEKVFTVTDTIAASWAGSVAQNQLLVKYLKSELKLHELRTHKKPTITQAASLLRSWIYQMIRRPSTMMDISAFLMAGKNAKGEIELIQIGADGTLWPVDDYIADGSGMMYSFGFFEKNFKPNLDEAQAVQLVVDAVDTSMQRDTASGNGVRVIVVDANGARTVATKFVDTHAK